MTDGSDDTGDGKVIMTLGPSPGRLWLGIFSCGLLGCLLVYIVFAGRPAAHYQVLFLVLAFGAFWLARGFWQARSALLILTETELKTGSGRVLLRVDNVRSVERGAFAFKPPNGFLVRLKEPMGRGWAPGLWWQRGRILGVGGVVSAGQSRAMAEILTALSMGLLPETR